MTLDANPFVAQADSYGAEQMRRAFSTFINSGGGVVGANDLQVTALSTPNMSVDVSSGQVWVPGTLSTQQGQYYGLNNATLNVLVPGSDPTNPRIDLIAVVVDDAAYGQASTGWDIVDVPGTPASSPTIPTAPANSIVLAQIAVNAAVSSITSADITDVRPIASIGGTPVGGNPIFNVKAYGANVGTGSDDSAAVQATFTAAGTNGVVVFPPNTTYLISTPISCANDVTVIAYGATIRWTGNTTNSMFYNPNPINLKWFGGTIDGNNIKSPSLFGFGGTSGITPTSTYMKSCVARDIQFINVAQGCWSANSITSTGTNPNTNVIWDNLSCVKSSGNAATDMFELVAENADVLVYGNDNGTGSFVFTSAWLKRAKIRSYTLGGKQNFILQSYTGNGSAPFFDQLEVYGNGQLLLNNGNLTDVETVSGTIELYPMDCTDVEVGNSAYDNWHHTIVKGTLRIPSGGGALTIGTIDSLTLDVEIDGAALPSTYGGSGAVVLAGSQTVSFLRINHLVAKNFVSGSVTGIIGVLPSSFLSNTRIYGGDITQNVAVPLVTAANLQYLSHGGNAVIRGVVGYNPTGPQTAPTVPASGTALTNPFPFDANVCVSGGIVTAIELGGLAAPTGLALTTATTGGTLAASTAYEYQVTAVNAVGETLASALVSVTTGSTTSTNTITATWNPVYGATSYNIYGRVSGSIAKIANVTSPTYTDTGSVAPSGALPTQNTTGAVGTGLTSGGIMLPAGETITLWYDNGAANPTLSTALTEGTSYTSLSVTAIPVALAVGDTVTLVSGNNQQTFTLTAAAAASATSLTVESTVANFSYPTTTIVENSQWGQTPTWVWIGN